MKSIKSRFWPGSQWEILPKRFSIFLLIIFSVKLSVACLPTGKPKPIDTLQSNTLFSFLNQTFIETKDVTIMTTTTDPSGVSTEVEQQFIYKTQKRLVNIDSQGNLIFDRTPMSFFIQQTSSGNTTHGAFRYDSTQDPDSKIPSSLWTQAKEVSENLRLTLSPKGKIESINGLDQFKNNMLSKANKLFGDTFGDDPYQLAQITDYYNPDNIRQRINHEWESFIPLERNPGHTWQTETTQVAFADGSIKLISEYHYVSDNDGLAQIGITQTVSLIRKPSANVASGEKPNYGYTQAQGFGKGTIWVIKGVGWIKRGAIDQNLKYVMEIKNPSTKESQQYTITYRNKTQYND